MQVLSRYLSGTIGLSMLQGKLHMAGPSEDGECIRVSLIDRVVRKCVKQNVCESLNVRKKVLSLGNLK